MVRQALTSGRVTLVPVTALARKDPEPGVLGWSRVTGGMSVEEVAPAARECARPQSDGGPVGAYQADPGNLAARPLSELETFLRRRLKAL